ncbi:MAG: hypothetical protein AB7H93_02125 [Vicinamibacterales bacterium]
MRRWGRIVVVSVGLCACGAATAAAQILGTFRWQLSPYCNVLLLQVEQKGGVYLLAGTDNQCGAARLAPAAGTAHLNPDGSISIAVGVTRPDGVHVATNATISLGTFAGTWTDDAGNSGTFTFNPSATAGQARPLRFSGTYSAGGLAASAAASAVNGVAFPRQLQSAPVAVAANVVRVGQPPTLACPGSAGSPRAEPGQLCLYESSTANVDLVCAARSSPTWLCGFADRTGFSLAVYSTAAGEFWSVGTWAVTVP